jgi:polyhydroxyalkanoate synthase
VLDALAPSNFPLTNPAVLKAIVDEGGANLVRGARRFAADFPGLPSTVDTSKFGVGENLALTPGTVIKRTDVYELIEYAPQTETVREIPLLFVPPTINKFYVLDLAPGRSMVEYLVQQGQRVFMISWRNPGDEHGHFDFDTYAAAILEARAAVAKRTRSKTVHLNAACSGGILSAAALGAKGTEGVASLTLMVCALDNEQAGTASALASKELATLAIAESARKGYLDGQQLAGVFTWLRPNDLVWNYVVNNYLLGKQPPAFDVLYWNQDTVRLAAGLHRDFIKLALDNALARPNAFTTLESPVNLSAIEIDSYIVAAKNDHIVPWENAAKSVDLLGGDTRFVLSSSGHIQALVNPPANNRSSYRVENTQLDGSWWEDYDAWLAARSGDSRPAPTPKPGAKAPGTYVHAN